MQRPYQLPVWTVDPLPMGAAAFVLWSAGYWRAVSKAALEARQ